MTHFIKPDPLLDLAIALSIVRAERSVLLWLLEPDLVVALGEAGFRWAGRGTERAKRARVARMLRRYREALGIERFGSCMWDDPLAGRVRRCRIWLL